MNFGDTTSFGNSFNYPAVKPRNELNLIRNRSIPPEYTFTRNSAGTYVGPDGFIKTANANQPRFDYDPITGEFKGLLIEESRTNLLRQSIPENGLTRGNGIFSSNATIAPDGTLTASLVTTGAYSSRWGWYNNYGSITISGGAGVVSFYAKSNGSPWVGVGCGLGNPWGYSNAAYNLVTGASRTYRLDTHGYQFKRATAVGNGWFRVEFDVITPSNSIPNGEFLMFNTALSGSGGDLVNGFAGDGVSGAYFWGLQVESGSFATSLIPTSGSTVTRLADQLVLNQSLSTSGTFFVEARPTTGTTLGADNGTNAYYISPTLNTTTKNALYYNTNRVLTMSSLSSPVQDINIQSTSGLNRVSLGFDRLNNTNYINGHIKNFKYYDSPITEDNLRSLTGSNKNISRSDGTIVTSGLVLNLDAGNQSSYPGSGTTWTDLSGNGNNGTLTNGPTYSSSNKGSIVFDGVDDFIINSSTTNIPTGSSSRTIQFWTYPRSDTNTFIQLGTGGGGNQVYIVQFYNISGIRYLFTDGVNANNNLSISGSQLPTLNAWNHITFGNSGQNWFYYVNSILQASGTWSVTLNTVGQKYIVGKRDDIVVNIVVNTVSGNISQVSIYNRALSATEVQQNFNALRGRFGI